MRIKIPAITLIVILSFFLQSFNPAFMYPAGAAQPIPDITKTETADVENLHETEPYPPNNSPDAVVPEIAADVYSEVKTEASHEVNTEVYLDSNVDNCRLNEPPPLNGAPYRIWKPGSIFFRNLDPLTVSQGVYKQETPEKIERSLAAGPNPQINIDNIQMFLNHVAGRRVINHSDRPDLADRSNETETIDPMSAGALALKRTDLILPGRDGLDLELGRYYNTNQASIGTPKVSLRRFVCNNKGECTYGWELYLWDQQQGRSFYYGVYDSIDAAFLIGENQIHEDPKRWNNYIVFQVNMAEEREYTSIKFWNYVDYENHLRNRYDLGAGWSFSFPSIQRREGDTVWDTRIYLTFYDGKGASYEIKFTSDAADSNLSGYQGKDMVVDMCGTLGKPYSNGREDAVYVWIENGDKEHYFSWDGRLIGVKDRKGNEIKYFYAPRNVMGAQRQYIKQIIDSAGRTLDFNYTDNSDTSGRIDVTVNDPAKTKSLTLSYIKDCFEYTFTEYYWDSLHQSEIY